jgi:cardiolipin synthase A/B
MLLAVVLVAHALGLLTSLAALMSARTSQGAVAWIVSLNTLPYLAVPAYWIFGRPKFEGYASARRGEDSALRRALHGIGEGTETFRAWIPETRGGVTAVERLARMPVLRGNETELLVDGEAAFGSMLRGIASAERYLLVQFYTIEDDGVGRRFQEALLRKAEEGVRVHLLYDRIGSRGLPGRYVKALEAGGVGVRSFLSSTTRIRHRFRPRLQVNFRNHRKVLVVDGREGWLGGLNASDAYLGLDPKVGPWRDTHLRVRGPAALGLQLSFLEDWHWSAEEVLSLDWEPQPAGEGADEPVLIVPSGPADPSDTASLMMHHAIHAANRRLWIATPYFVPDGALVSALELAGFRGVDVRILVPEEADVPLVHLAKFAVLEPLLAAGVKILRYTAGFMHTKAFLVDDRAAGVGTVNLDSRSLRLNFEITALLMDRDAVARVEAMLARDFQHAEPLTLEEVRARPFLSRAASRAAYLLEPVL